MRKRPRFPIFFLHIPKTASTSAFAFLRAALTERSFCPNVDGTWRASAADVRGFDVYWGHFTIDFINEMAVGGTRLIMLREPVARIVSLYDYWRSHRWEHIHSALPPGPENGPAVAKSLSFPQFIVTDQKFVSDRIHNAVARQLLGSRFDSAPDVATASANAIETLHTFDWVGISECFDPSLRLLAALLHLKISDPLPALNQTYDKTSDDPVFERITRTVPTNDELDAIAERNTIDAAIYEAAVRLFNERVRQVLGRKFANCGPQVHGRLIRG